MSDKKYFLFAALFLLIFISASVNFNLTDKQVKRGTKEVQKYDGLYYENYRHISIKYFNY